MSEMIERVARAILEADVASTQEDFPDTPPNILRVAAEALFERHHKAMARAAIEAMRAEELEDALRSINQWVNAYPLSVFPEPDLKKVRALLAAGGITLDAVSASNMRHVLSGIAGLIPAAIRTGN